MALTNTNVDNDSANKEQDKKSRIAKSRINCRAQRQRQLAIDHTHPSHTELGQNSSQWIDNGRNASIRRAGDRQAFLDGPHARDQLIIGKRLDDVVVGAGVQRLHPGYHIAAGRDDQHEGIVLALADGVQDVPPVTVRQGEVEQDDVVSDHRQRSPRFVHSTDGIDDLPGVGPARKRIILQHFGSPERFLAASREELESVPGLPQKVARDIHAYVNKIR